MRAWHACEKWYSMITKILLLDSGILKKLLRNFYIFLNLFISLDGDILENIIRDFSAFHFI